MKTLIINSIENQLLVIVNQISLIERFEKVIDNEINYCLKIHVNSSFFEMEYNSKQESDHIFNKIKSLIEEI